MITLEQEIQQTIFRNYRQKVLLNIIYTANRFRANQVKLFKPYGISPEQYNVLRILRGQRGKTIGVNQIQERMLDKNSNASRLIDKLNEKLLVDRIVCKKDRRQVDIFITQAGMELLIKIDELIIEEEKSILLTNEEAEQLNYILNKLRTN